MSPLRLSRGSIADAVVLLATGVALLGARALLRFARAGDDHLADFGGDDN